MKEWKLEKEIREAIESQGLKITKVIAGCSPYSPFDLIAHTEGFVVGEEPAEYKLSPVEVKTTDPQTAYKGRHGRGRLFMAIPNEDGLVSVPSNSNVEITLQNGMCLGKKAKLATIGDLFPEL